MIRMIETKNITKVLGERFVLRGVNLTIARGETVALLGANGAGKSTFLKIIAGLLKPTDGEVFIDEKKRKKDDYTFQKQIGFLGHHSLLYDALTPVENLTYFAKLYDVNSPEKRIEQLIEDVGLTLFKNEPVRTFSRGMVQRLAIARTLLHEPNVLLLDEPYTGLDQQAVEQFNELLFKLKEDDVTAIVVTHDFEHIHKVCDRAVILRKGKITEDEKLHGRSLDWMYRLYHGELTPS